MMSSSSKKPSSLICLSFVNLLFFFNCETPSDGLLTSVLWFYASSGLLFLTKICEDFLSSCSSIISSPVYYIYIRLS